MSGHDSDGGSSVVRAKRQRSVAACELCRNRKLACDSRQPCERCKSEGRTCTYEARAERTPLTRARMSELEQRVEIYEQLWAALCPQLALRDVEQTAKVSGLNAALDLIKLAGLQTNAPISSVPIESTVSNDVDPNNMFENAIPATRLPSPSTVILKPASEFRTEQPEIGNYAWHEDDAGDESTRQLDGMGWGVPSADKGISFLGLSSSATFLNAIRRLSVRGKELSTVKAPCFPQELGTLLPMTIASHDSASPLNAIILRPRFQMPPMSEVRHYVDSYFTYFHSLTPLVHEPSIRAQITGAVPIPTSVGSHVLLNMIFAMGAFDLASSEQAEDGRKYYRAARTALQSDMLEEGSLELVQGLAIMANYLQRSNKPNAGYLCLGWAIRMGVALGLHVHQPSTTANLVPSALKVEMRSRVWWALVTLEAGCSVTFGRPHALSNSQLASVPLPINCDDEELTVSTVEAPNDVARPTTYSALIVQAHLARATCHVHDRILHSARAPTLEQIKWCDDHVVSALDRLPDFMRSHGPGPHGLALAVQLWRIRDFRAILFRPVLLAAAWDANRFTRLSPMMQECIGLCRTLALSNLEDIANFVRQEGEMTRGTEWYALFFAFQASLTILLSMEWEPYHTSASYWRSMLSTTAGWFRQLRSLRRVGLVYANILESFLDQSPAPAADSTGADIAQTNSIDFGSWPQNSMDQASCSVLDVERYWSEIWGNEFQPDTFSAVGLDEFLNASLFNTNLASNNGGSSNIHRLNGNNINH